MAPDGMVLVEDGFASAMVGPCSARRPQRRPASNAAPALCNLPEPPLVFTSLQSDPRKRAQCETVGETVKAAVDVVDGLCLTPSPSLVGGLGARGTAWADEHAAPVEPMHVPRNGSMLFLRDRLPKEGSDR